MTSTPKSDNSVVTKRRDDPYSESGNRACSPERITDNIAVEMADSPEHVEIQVLTDGDSDATVRVLRVDAMGRVM